MSRNEIFERVKGIVARETNLGVGNIDLDTKAGKHPHRFVGPDQGGGSHRKRFQGNDNDHGSHADDHLRRYDQRPRKQVSRELVQPLPRANDLHPDVAPAPALDEPIVG